MRRLLALALCGVLGACGDNEAAPDLAAPDLAMAPAPEPLHLRQVDWNSRMVELGQVAGVVEQGEDLVILSDKGAQLLSNGQAQASDVSVRDWRQGAVIAAADLSGAWMAAVDGAGRVRRLRNRSVMDDVSARYGLGEEQVRQVAPLDDGRVAFLVADALQVADTRAGKLARYLPDVWKALAGRGARVALLAEDRVVLLDLARQESLALAVPGAQAVAFDPHPARPEGRLLVVTPTELLVEEGTRLRALARLPGGQGRALAATAEGVWIADGDRLLHLSPGQEVLRASEPGRIAADARLLGSAAAGGDVWVLSGGALTRLSDDTSSDQELWQKTVLPMYTRRCAVCHDPGGSSLIDLSTYASWTARRKLMDQRVVQGKPTPMPPLGTGTLTAEELTALKAWIAGG